MSYVTAFIASGIVVVLAGTALARYADAIAEATKLGRLWIGSVLLAGATSLPELTTDIAAVRFGATDLAVGDLLPPRKQVLQQVAFDHALAASLAISLNALAAVLVIIRPDSSFLWISSGAGRGEAGSRDCKRRP